MANETDSNKCCKYVIVGIRCQSGNLMKLKLCVFPTANWLPCEPWIYISSHQETVIVSTHICFLRMEFEICYFGVKNFHCGRIVWWSISLSDQEPFAIFHKWAGWPIRCKRNSLTNISHYKPTTIEICTIERLEWKTGNIIAFSETLISLEICNAIAYHAHDDQCQWRHQPPQKQQLR